MRVGHVLVGLRDGGDRTLVVGVDVTTGASAWEVTGRVMTDGGRLIGSVAPSGASAGDEVVALDPADGTVAWRGPLPDGQGFLDVHGHLLVWTEYDGPDAPARITVLR